jgi:hypothetical protein
LDTGLYSHSKSKHLRFVKFCFRKHTVFTIYKKGQCHESSDFNFFFIKHLPLGPWLSNKHHFDFFQKLAKIFAAPLVLHRLWEYFLSTPVQHIGAHSPRLPAHHKLHTYKEYHSVCPSSEYGLPPTPHPQASVPPPPCFWGEGNTRWRERGWESPNSDEGHTLCSTLYMYILCAAHQTGGEVRRRAPPPTHYF